MKSSLSLVFIILFSSCLSAQVIGTIFDREDADSEFGEVVNSVIVKNDSLVSLLNTAGNYIMFNIDGNIFKAVDDKRKSIVGKVNSDNEVYYRLSTSQIISLIEKGGKEITDIEMRPKTLTLTNGEFTLERSLPCPPYCP